MIATMRNFWRISSGGPPVGRPCAGATKLELDMCFISACCQTLIFVVVIIAL